MFSKKIACFPIFDDSWWTLSWGERSSRSLCDFLETCRRRSLVHDLLLSCACDSSPTNLPMHELRSVVGYLLVDQYSLLTPFGSCHSPLFLIGRFAAHGLSYLPPSDQIGFFFLSQFWCCPTISFPSPTISVSSILHLCAPTCRSEFFLMIVFVVISTHFFMGFLLWWVWAYPPHHIHYSAILVNIFLVSINFYCLNKIIMTLK